MSGSSGFNTFHGFDQGPPPPGMAPQQPYGYSQYQQHPTWNWPTSQPTYPATPAPAPVTPHGNTYPIYSYAPPPPSVLAQPYANWQPPPGFPGTHHPHHLTATTAGYDYLFPEKHARIHVFKTKEKPWQYKNPLWPFGPPNMPGGAPGPTVLGTRNSEFVKVMVPLTTTIKDLMKNLGCNNPVPAKNRLYEITEHGGGKWLKGMEIGGENAKACAKTIKDYGWDETRTGEPGKKPLIWIYVTKD